MNTIEKNNCKDKILNAFIDTKSLEIEKIAQASALPNETVAYLVEELSNDELVELREVTSKDSKRPKDYIVMIQNKGIFLRDKDGGYSKMNCQLRLNRFWQIVKIVAATANAIAIIIIGVLSLLSHKS